ncbi:unnamed protein product [Cylicostephanus goldi]|uniref:Uncharacterized protein n=1 Tax=Cylicostephanus goldi TaxID=71465 RepID=A0A3P7MZR8_CYLGO|nr:unnamed protein product [Cylicostephanus goldi]
MNVLLKHIHALKILVSLVTTPSDHFTVETVRRVIVVMAVLARENLLAMMHPAILVQLASKILQASI